MKYLVFYRESNNFTDILSDSQVKKYCKRKIKWLHHLLLAFSEGQENSDQTLSYLTIKFGDEIVNLVETDYSPVMNIDYTPEGNLKYKKYLDSLKSV